MSQTNVGTKEGLKQSLRAGRLTVGSWITLAHPAIAEMLARAGFDWLVVDLEHSVITLREAEELIRVIDLCGVAPLVRLTGHDWLQVKRVMDAGAHGVVVPMVTTAVEAEAAVAAVYYPPRGSRGVGLARAHGYGARFGEYVDWLESDAVIIAQIEHIEAVYNLEAILAVEGIDGYIVGPYDLSASMGLAGQFDHPDVAAALARVREVGGRSGKPGGIHIVEPEPEALHAHVEQGHRFLAYSVDTRMLDRMARDGLSVLRSEG
jgi:2-dehydro-3-deoxyglucarate aldolase